jgi:hypothetical protein
MTDQQFQILLLTFSFIGAVLIVLLSVIAYFVRASLNQITSRLDSHSHRHKDQAQWNEEKSGILEKHTTMIGIHDRELFGHGKRR